MKRLPITGLNKNTKKALIEIPEELRKLSKLIAIIGETLIDTKISKTKEYQEIFKNSSQKEEKRPGVT